MPRNFFALCIIALACSQVQAQLNKCVGAGGQVTYSDRACPASQTASAVKAAKIPEPTAEDRMNAEIRRLQDNIRMEDAELQRRRDAARPLPGAVSLGGNERDRGFGPNRPIDYDPDKCRGIRREQRVGKRIDPLGFDRSIQAMELDRAARRHCAD